MARRANTHKASARTGRANPRAPAAAPAVPPPASPAHPSTSTPEVEVDAGNDPNQLSLEALSLSDTAAKAPPSPKKALVKPFPFLDLPSELRLRIYEYYFATVSRVVDLDPDNQKRIHPLLRLFRTCRLIREEAGYLFWSTHTPRLFPTHPGRFFKTKKPLLARLKPHQRASLASLELRLGPGWSSPPRGWVVNDALGLSDCVRVRKVVVFVECDPSDGVFKGFRQADGFYEGFCRDLLTRVLDQLPGVDVVEFDAWPSVKRSGAMMTALVSLVEARSGLSIHWGPQRRWDDAVEDDIEIDIEQLLEASASSVSFAGYGSQSVMITA